MRIVRFMHARYGPEFLWAQVGIIAWLLVSLGLVIRLVGEIRFMARNPRIQDGEFVTSGRVLADALENLPTNPVFLLILTLAFVLYIAVRNRRYFHLLKQTGKLREEGDDGLSKHDWWVADDLRRRAFKLRTRAGLMLGSVWGLLFAGIYLSLYVLPVIVGTDPYRIFQSNFEGEFSSRLDALVEGRYWMQVDQESVPQLIESDSQVSFRVQNNTVLSYFSKDGGENWTPLHSPLGPSEKLHSAAGSRNGDIGIIAGNEGSIFRTTDGGENWTPVTLSLEAGERIRSAVLSDDGRVGIIASDEGSIFRTTDGGENWAPVSLPLQPNEWIVSAVLSGDGRVGIIAGDEWSIYRTTDGGESWIQVNLLRQPNKWIRLAVLSGDGRVGIIAGDEGSIYRTTDGGGSWIPVSLSLVVNERTISAVLSGDGRVGIIAGDEGSIYRTTDYGESWKPVNLSLEADEWIRSAVLSGDGRVGIVAGDEGSIYRTTDGGANWIPVTSPLGQFKEFLGTAVRQETQQSLDWLLQAFGDRVEVVVSQVGQNWVLTYDVGLVLRKQAAEEMWTLVGPIFRAHESIDAAGVSGDGRVGIVAGDEGSIYRTTDGGESWTPVNLSLEENERIRAAALSKDIQTGIVFGDVGSTYRTMDGGESWIPVDLSLEADEWIRFAVLSGNGRVGIIASDQGSIYRTWDSGENWRLQGSLLKQNEWVRIAALSSDGEIGIIVGDEGSVLRTIDGAVTWISTNLIPEGIAQITGPSVTDRSDARRIDINDRMPSAVSRSDRDAFAGNTNQDRSRLDWDIVATTFDGNHFVLSSYHELNRWRELSIQDVYRNLMNNDVLANSELAREIGESVDATPRPSLETSQESGSAIGEEGPSSTNILGLEQLTVTRIAVLTILFFLVQILVRVYQYNLRLAAFWQARADAILVSNSFSDTKEKPIGFDELVFAMAPDAQDFKASPKSPLDWIRFRKQS